MAKDYARQINQTRYTPRKVLLLIGIVMTLLGLVLSFIPANSTKSTVVTTSSSQPSPVALTKTAQSANLNPTAPANPVPTQANTSTNGAAQANSSTPTKAASDKVKFDFYTMLPKMQVSASTGNQTAQKPVAGQYIDQVAIFEDRVLAGKLLVALQLKGFNAQIVDTPSASGDQQKYRVILGPYNSQAAAEAAQKSLQQANISSTVMQQA